MTDDPEKRYTVKMGFEERMFLEKEQNRLRRQRFSRTGDLESVTYRDTVRKLIAELEHFREECTCVERPPPEDLPEPSHVVDP